MQRLLSILKSGGPEISASQIPRHKSLVCLPCVSLMLIIPKRGKVLQGLLKFNISKHNLTISPLSTSLCYCVLYLTHNHKKPEIWEPSFISSSLQLSHQLMVNSAPSPRCCHPYSPQDHPGQLFPRHLELSASSVPLPFIIFPALSYISDKPIRLFGSPVSHPSVASHCPQIAPGICILALCDLPPAHLCRPAPQAHIYNFLEYSME